MLSIIIPSRTEKFLNKTIQDVLDNATGDIEVFPVLDGYENTPYEKIIDPRVKYISLPNNGQMQKRQGINTAVSIAKGEYVMSLDAHCCVAKGFDEVLTRDCTDNMIMVPRRYRIDIETWDKVKDDKRIPIDYEYFMWQKLIPGFHDGSKKLKSGRFGGYKWDERTKERWNIPIDDILTFQGSCWIMKKDWFKKCGFMKVDGYTGWGQEAEELSFTTWQNGGRCVVNKNTWYAHLHKGKTHGRMYEWNIDQIRDSYNYSFEYWVNNNKEFFVSLVEKFWPIPNFPENWKEKLWPKTH